MDSTYCIKVQLLGECDYFEFGNSLIALIVTVALVGVAVDGSNPAPFVLIHLVLGCGVGSVLLYLILVADAVDTVVVERSFPAVYGLFVVAAAVGENNPYSVGETESHYHRAFAMASFGSPFPVVLESEQVQ